MAVEWKMDASTSLMRVTATGDVSDQEWSDTLGSALSEHGTKVGSVIIDVRECESRPAASFIADGAAWMRSAPKGALPSRWAVVVGSPRNLGTSKMLSSQSRSGHVEVRSFTDLARAEQWALASEEVTSGGPHTR